MVATDLQSSFSQITTLLPLRAYPHALKFCAGVLRTDLVPFLVYATHLGG